MFKLNVLLTYLGEESLSGLVYLVDVCQQLWTSVSSRAEKQRKEIFMNVLGGNEERALSFVPVCLNFVSDVAKIIQIKTNQPKDTVSI